MRVQSVRDWEVLRLATGQIAIDVVPGLGGTICSLRHLEKDVDVLWHTPWGLPYRGAVFPPGDAEALMLQTYPGGWQTIFPNGGDNATVNGVEWGFQGEARLAPMEWKEFGSSVILTARLVRSPFQWTKTISLRETCVLVEETVRNVGNETLEVMWGSEIALGPPLLSSEAFVEAGAAVVHPDAQASPGSTYDEIFPWPRVMGSYDIVNLRTLPGPGTSNQRLAYLADFAKPAMSVVNPELRLAVDLKWDSSAWPYVWYSLEAGRRDGFPWYGAGYFLSLTPCSGWPAHGVHEARRVSQSLVWLLADESWSSHMSVSLRSLDGAAG